MIKNSKVIQILVLQYVFLLITGCIPSLHKTKVEIKAVLETEYKSHIEKNASLLVLSLSDCFASVDNGKISFPRKEETQKRFESYFGSVNFIKWDDIEAPIIRFSDDKSLAYAMVRKQVVLEIKANPGSRDTTNFAWTAIYRNSKKGWKLECMTSTDDNRKP